MLYSLWSAKGGSGTSTVSAALALALAPRHAGVRLADLDGDQPALLGLGTDPTAGLADWLTLGPLAPGAALDRMAVPVPGGLQLLPRGRRPVVTDGPAAAALAVLLRTGSSPAVIDCSGSRSGAAVFTSIADASVLVTRGCYLALRRAVRSEELSSTHGVVLIEEPGRTLGARDVASVLGRPVVATVPVLPAIARAIDAGVLPARLPGELVRAAEAIVEYFGTPRRGRGTAA